MRLALLGLLALTFLGLYSCEDEEDFFAESCSRLRGIYSCEGVEMPEIVYQEMPDGLRGQYRGGSQIYINDKLEGDDRGATIFHEFVHYLQHKVGDLKLPGPPEDICKAENEAFWLTDNWRKDKGLDPVGPTWWKAYWYCWKWYGSEGGFGVWFDEDGNVTVIQ